MIRKFLASLMLFAMAAPQLAAQTSDDQYRMPLTEVLKEVEKRFDVEVRYSPDMVKDKVLSYALWRFRYNADETLASVLAPFDMFVNKSGDKTYKLKYFEYHRKTPEEGKAQLDYLATLYNDKASWEQRKAELRACMWDAIKLAPMPARPASKPIVTNKRTMDGYTIENVAIEVLPGVYATGSLYRPLKVKGKVPVILNPDGHFGDGRYRADCQYRCAMLARMGAIAFSYDLFAWGESQLQFKSQDHRRSLAMTVQALNSLRILDYLLSFKEADPERVAITGGSGGGSQTMLITALDDRIKLSVPVVMLSSYHSGGCPCESGMPVHLCGGGTNNVELAGMAAPRPQLVISDGKDWTAHVPEQEFPHLKKIYSFYNGSVVENAHFPKEGHDYGVNKRMAMYRFVAKHFNMDLRKVQDKQGNIDESKVTIEPHAAMYVFGEKGEKLPASAVRSFEELEKLFK